MSGEHFKIEHLTALTAFNGFQVTTKGVIARWMMQVIKINNFY